jgi:hypothetical protein
MKWHGIVYRARAALPPLFLALRIAAGRVSRLNVPYICLLTSWARLGCAVLCAGVSLLV